MNIRNISKDNLNFKFISNSNDMTIYYLTDNNYEMGVDHKIICNSNFFISLKRFTSREGILIYSDDSMCVNGYYISDLWDCYDYGGVKKTIKNTSRILS